MKTGLFLEDLTSQQLLRNLANRVAGVFGLADFDTCGIGLNSRERALFRTVLHQIAVTELWVTRLQFRQFFGSVDKTGMGGNGMRSHVSLMAASTSHDEEARLYQKAYMQLRRHVMEHTEGTSQTSVTAAMSSV
jgi:hypothetical protein